MKRYLLFKGDVWYPGGGWTDFAGDFASVDEAIVSAPIGTYGDFGEAACDWYQVVDTQSGKVVAEDTRVEEMVR